MVVILHTFGMDWRFGLFAQTGVMAFGEPAIGYLPTEAGLKLLKNLNPKVL